MKPSSFRARVARRILALSVIVLIVAAPLASAQVNESDLPDAKKTSLGLYLTAAEAYDKWRADSQAVKVLDVRTTEEYLFIGHAPMAWNVPLMSQAYEWDTEKQRFKMQPNPGFVTQVTALFEPQDPILVMCRSGGRSAMAVNMLADAGYTNVYQIVDGMEGDEVKDPESVFLGQRLKNGWKNSGLPWTYDPDPQKMRFITEGTKE
jgi:rhodanese-related sulfurtransferase